MKIGEETLQNPPYKIELRMDDETVWETRIGTCNRLVVAVSEGGTVEVGESTAC
ncbi:hypothetical protein [Haloarcula sediminis]|uniref:hypothetical protein n=1 Tax=Haloarcula sediminis TaxID=3111777 RepID=UPI002D7813D8|nr:hypothetical protein [Haloarcula sp. CK38]